MAILNAQGIANLAVALLSRSLVLPNTVSRIPGQDFSGPNGSVITVRVRQPRSARTQASPGATITFDDIDEVAVPVTVNHLYNATHVTDEDLTLGLQDFTVQVAAPMVAAIAVGAEDEVAAALNAEAADASFALVEDPDDTDTQLKAAREALSLADVPMNNRTLACSPSIISRLLGVDKFVRADASGDGGTALQQATFGRVYGFRVVESAALTAGTACAYHSSAVAFGNRSPAIPAGAADAAAAQEGGIALRVIRDFDLATLSDGVAASTFAGASVIFEDDPPTLRPRLYRIDTATA